MIDSVENSQLLELILSRRSIRTFLPRDVPAELVIQLIESATWAPSAHNRQPWRFVVLSAKETRARFVEEMGILFNQDLTADGISEQEVDKVVQRSKERILNAPVAILVCLDISQADTYPDQRRQTAEYIMGVQGVAMAGSTLLLAAHAVGLGGVWICAPLFVPETTRTVLDLPAEWEPQGLILLGYPAKIPKPRSRQSVREVTRYA